MSTSVSPSIGSTTLTTCQPQSSITNNSNMRLPSMNEFLRKTDRLSERNRTYRHLNSPPRTNQMPSEDLVDLTSDSLTDSFALPSFQQFSDTSLSSTDYSNSNYFTLFDMAQRPARRSREPTAGRERSVKRRRGNDFGDFLDSFSLDSPAATSRPSYRVEQADVLDLITPEKEKESGIATPKRKPSEEPILELEEDGTVAEAQTEQDKQLADTIKAQAGMSSNASKLNQLTCIICMDNMENMTATVCGHVFCHTCIMEALIAGENRADGRPNPKCPMCRHKLTRRSRKAPEIVPLSLKLVKRSDKAKGKQKEVP